MFSKACEYGIKAAIFIATQSYEGKRVGPKAIAKEIDSPQAFTAKILQALVKEGVVTSVKGAYGGFEIDRGLLSQIKLAAVVNAIDGDHIYKGCGLGLHTCDANQPCPVHNKFEVIRNDLKNMLEQTSLEELALGVKSGAAFLRV
ncbi:Rrf2 family transcriptional regulator [Tamlana haliotis]|uniref:Rrf2 family transcriptional regulator n=1 Tax=Pseudotamlana haliotis TaxID=2614804 RepID=A0A6N6MJC8_9FLAO|nr:Rrf2 family transcriptional regulator [Tamlana haliotis]KAB1069674.1 Rrf2 family transcriptional regulator [Tamlana haliotis]